MTNTTAGTFTSPDFALARGGGLAEMTLAYETYGTLSTAGDNAILVCHGYTSSQKAGTWWDGLIGPGKTLDTERWFIVCANMPGSAHGSTGPRSLDPATSRPYGPDFPDLSLADMVRAQVLMLDDLGVGRLHAIVGYSYGGYLTLQWGADFADRMARLVVVASGFKGRGSPDLLREMEARFATCPGWNGGHYYGNEEAGGIRDLLVEIRLETLRGYGADEALVDELGDRAAAERALDDQARAWAAEFDLNSLMALRKPLIGHDITPRLGEIRAPVLYVLARTDTLFPPKLAAPALAAFESAGVTARYHEIDSEHGHAAPRTAWQKWREPLAAFLAGSPS